MYGLESNQDPKSAPANFVFDSRSIRHGFIRKVYGILMVQISVSVGAMALVRFHEPTTRFLFLYHEEFSIISVVIFFTSYLGLLCCDAVRRKTPLNFIFLGLFTLAESFMLSMGTLVYDTDTILLAGALTVGVCIVLTIFAFQTCCDFTIIASMLFFFALALMCFGIVDLLVQGRIITLVYSSFGAIVFSLYLIYDTQLMMEGRHKYSISPEEYIFASLNLYLDVISIFWHILKLVNKCHEE